MQYNQIKSFVKTLIETRSLRTTYSKLESWLKTGMIWNKTLSKLYGIMIDQPSADKVLCGKWEKELHIGIGD